MAWGMLGRGGGVGVGVGVSVSPSVIFALCGAISALVGAADAARTQHVRQADCELPSSFQLIGQFGAHPECDSLISPISTALRNVLSQVDTPTRPQTFAELIRVLAENEVVATDAPLCGCLAMLNEAALQSLFPNPVCAQTGYFPDLGITNTTCPFFHARWPQTMSYSSTGCICPTVPPSPVNVTALGITASPSPPPSASPTASLTKPDSSSDGSTDGNEDGGLATWLWVLIAIGVLIVVGIGYTCQILRSLSAEQARQGTDNLVDRPAASKKQGGGKPSTPIESAVNPLFSGPAMAMAGMAASLPRGTLTGKLPVTANTPAAEPIPAGGTGTAPGDVSTASADTQPTNVTDEGEDGSVFGFPPDISE